MTPGGCTAFGRLPFSDRQSPQRTWWKGEQPVFEHLIAAVAKFFFAAGLVAGASGAGNVDLPEWHLPKAPVHTEKTHEPQASPEATKTPERYSFESLLKECVTRYTGHLDGAKDVCTAAIAASGLEADAFWAKYRSLLVKELRDFARSGEWEGDEQKSSAKLKTSPTRRVFMKKIQDRWFLENRQKEARQAHWQSMQNFGTGHLALRRRGLQRGAGSGHGDELRLTAMSA